jgi:hypothetical protein
MSETTKSDSSQHAWEQGWEDHEMQQLRRLAKLSFPEKLAWLEEAHRLVRQLAKQNNPPSTNKE